MIKKNFSIVYIIFLSVFFGSETCLASAKEISEPCASMAPLLQLFPQQHTLAGQPESYRGCKNEGFGIELRYSDKKKVDSDGDPMLEYTYLVLALSGDSAYAESYINSAQIQKNEFRKLITGTGNIFVASYNGCKRLAGMSGANPAAVVKSVNGFEVCVLNGGSNKWTADALYKNNIFLRIQLAGESAAKYSNANEAAAHLIPLFGLFNLSGDI